LQPFHIGEVVAGLAEETILWYEKLKNIENYKQKGTFIGINFKL